jgi:hypothetical protein
MARSMPDRMAPAAAHEAGLGVGSLLTVQDFEI